MSTVELPIGGLTELLREIVEINSVSDNLVGIRRIAERIAAELTALGFDVKLHAGEHRRQRVDRDLEGAAPLEPDDGSERGLHLVGRLDGDPGSTTVLLLGHMDTVYAQSSPFQALQVDGDLACGPGVVDMKGGLVVILGGLRALIESGAPRPSLLIVFNSDEEVSSNTSRGLIEELIASHRPDFCFCVEPGERRADGTEELVVERKGHCCLHVGIYGRAAHASKPELGISALSALARKIVRLEALASQTAGVTLNVGRWSGAPDATYNTVPRYAQAEIDVRFDDVESGRAFVEQAKAILGESATSPDNELTTRSLVEEVFFAPPMGPHPGQQRLIGALMQAATAIDYPHRFVPVKRPGRSDANIAANHGIPSIDGLGIVGSGSHVAFGESARLSSLEPRARLLALALASLARAGDSRSVGRNG